MTVFEVQGHDGKRREYVLSNARAGGAFQHTMSASWYRFREDGQMVPAEDDGSERGMGCLIGWDGQPVTIETDSAELDIAS